MSNQIIPQGKLAEMNAFAEKYKADLPVEEKEMAQVLKLARDYADYLFRAKPKQHAIVEPGLLSELYNIADRLTCLQNDAEQKRRKELGRRRNFTKSEEFAYKTLEQAAAKYREQLKHRLPVSRRAFLKERLTQIEGQLTAIIEGRMAERTDRIRARQSERRALTTVTER
jgi:hypothetical protein